MTKKFNKGVKITTPFGRAGFCALLKPSTKFDPDGEYNAKVILDDGPETAAFIEQLQGLYEDAYRTNLATAQAEKPKLTSIKKADPPFKRVMDEDTGEELPQWAVNARMKAPVRNKEKQITGYRKPMVLDAKNQPVVTPFGQGSIIRFQATALPFYTAALGSGLQLKLIGVQVKDLVPFGGEKATFEELPDGFVETAKASDPVETMHAPATPSPVTAPATASPVTAPAATDETGGDDNADWV